MWAKHNFLSIFKSFLSVSKQGSFFNVHFQILSALARKFRSFRAHQCSSDQMQTLKDHNAHITRALGIAYRLWLPFSINTVFNLTKLKNITHTHTHTHIYIYIYYILALYLDILALYIYIVYYIYIKQILYIIYQNIKYYICIYWMLLEYIIKTYY